MRTFFIQYTLFALLFLIGIPFSAFAAEGSIRVSPEQVTAELGKQFEIRLYAYPDGALINAGEAELSFDPSVLQVTSVSTAGSALSLWPTEPTYSNETGTIRFSGWATQPFQNPQTLLLSVTVEAKRSGVHTVRISSGALLDAGTASNVVTSLGVARLEVTPQTVTTEITEGAVLGASFTSPDAPPPAPRITEYPTDARAGDKLVVRGIASPNVRVALLLFSKEGLRVLRSTVDADSEGKFTYVSSERLKAGTYELSAESYSETGVLGKASPTVTFSVAVSGYELLIASAERLVHTSLLVWVGLLLAGFFAGFGLYRFLAEKRLI